MFDSPAGAGSAVVLTLYTDSFVIKGSLDTRQRRVTDMLNLAEDPFIVLADVTFDEFGTSGRQVRAAYAQVNLGSILFAVADTPAEPAPELRTYKIEQRAIVSIAAVQGHRPHPPARGAKPADRADRADRHVPAGDRGDVLVGHARRAEDDGRHGRDQPIAGPDRGAPRGGRPVGRHRPARDGVGGHRRSIPTRRPGRGRRRPGRRTPHRPRRARRSGPRATRPGPRRTARPSASDRPAGPAGCPTPPSRRRRPPRPRVPAASARTRASPPRPPSRRSRPSAGRG